MRIETSPPPKWPPPPNWSSKSVVGYSVFVVTGWNGHGDVQPLLAWATTETGEKAWAEVFAQAPDTPPKYVVADEDTAIVEAAKKRWGVEPHWLRCLFHLMSKFGGKIPFELDDTDVAELRELADHATRGVVEWDEFCNACDKVIGEYDARSLEKWLRRLDMRNVVRTQLALHLDKPQSNSAAEALIRALKTSFNNRLYMFQNKQRTNRLFQLFIINQNRQAQTVTFSRIIRQHLATDGALTTTRSILDAVGEATLRPTSLHASRTQLKPNYLEEQCIARGLPVPPPEVIEQFKPGYVRDLDGQLDDDDDDPFTATDPDDPF